MHYSGPYKVIKKHSKFYVILNSRQVPEAVAIDWLKRFVERHSSDSADGDDLHACQESNEMSTFGRFQQSSFFTVKCGDTT